MAYALSCGYSKHPVLGCDKGGISASATKTARATCFYCQPFHPMAQMRLHWCIIPSAKQPM
eukprot:6212321-Amphidinium_carterae.1